MVGWLKRIFGGGEPKALPRKVDLFTLQVGDIVVYLDETYEVSQRIVNHAHGFFWYDYRLSGGAERELWLAVEEDDDLVVALYEPIQLDVPGTPPRELQAGEVRFTLDERVEADARITRASGSETRTRAQYWDYQGPEGALLSVARWGDDETEVLLGRAVAPSALELMAPE